MYAKLSVTLALLFMFVSASFAFRDGQPQFSCSSENSQITETTGSSFYVQCTLDHELKRDQNFTLEKYDKTDAVKIGFCFGSKCVASARYSLIRSKINDDLILLRIQNLHINDSGEYYACLSYGSSKYTGHKTLILNLTVVPLFVNKPTCDTILLKDKMELELSCEWGVHGEKVGISIFSSSKVIHNIPARLTYQTRFYSMGSYKASDRVKLSFSLTELVTSEDVPDTCEVSTDSESESCQFSTSVENNGYFACGDFIESDSEVWLLNRVNVVKLNANDVIETSKAGENPTLVICGKEEYNRINVTRISRMVHFEHGKCHTVNVGRRDQEKVYSMSPGCTSTPENDHLSVGYPYDSNMESNVTTILGTQVANVTLVTQASNQNPTTAYDSKTTSDPSSNDGLMTNGKSGISFYAVSSLALFLSVGSFIYIVWRKGCRRRRTSFHLHGHGNNHQRHVPEFEMTNNREDTTTPQISSQLPSQTIDTHPSLIPSHLDTVQRNIAQQPRDQLCPTLPPRIRYGGSNETTTVECYLLADRESGANTLPSVTGRKKEGKLHQTKCDPEEFIPTTMQNNDCKAIVAGSPDSTTSFDNKNNTVDDVQCDLGGAAAAVDIHNVKESPLRSPCSFSATCEDPIGDLGPTGNDQEEQLNIELHNESSTPTSNENIESLYAKPNKNPNMSDLSSPAINTTSLGEGDSGNHQTSVHPSDYEELRQ